MKRMTLSLAMAWGFCATTLVACGGNGLVKIPGGTEAGVEGSPPDAGAGHKDGETSDASDGHDMPEAADGSLGEDADAELPFDASGDVTPEDAGCTSPTECPKTGSACVVAVCSMGLCETSDALADTPCSDHGGNICNGSGQCLASDGSPCSGPGVCLSDHCSGDGYCCNTPCKGSCMTCSTGTCADVAVDETTPTCNGENSCDGAGHCLGDLGQFCSLPTDCLSNQCSGDGFCCDSPCDGSCETCSTGTCADVAEGEMTGTCDGVSSCDGFGNCLEDLGQGCTDPTQCASGYCSSDGVCCAETCTGDCVECTTFDGELCEDVAPLGTTLTCDGTNACDGAGDCLLADGQACTLPGQCASGHCGKLLTCK